MKNNYFMVKTLQASFTSVISNVTAALAQEGYGVFADVNVQNVLQSKLGVTMPKTRIIGTNKPDIGLALLQSNPKIGVLLPFSIIIHETTQNEIEVAIVNPEILLQPVDQDAVNKIASKVKKSFLNVLSSL